MLNEYERVVLTGGTGYLGRHVLNKIQSLHEDIVVFVRDESNIDSIDLNKNNIRVFNYNQDIRKVLSERVAVLHFATDYGYNSTDLETIDVNLMLPLRIISYLEKGSLFLNTDTVLPKRINSYTLSKKHLREWLDNYTKKLNIINLEIEHFYGAGDDKTKFVVNIIDKLLNKEKEIPLTKGEQYRDFIYIDDVISAIVIILENVNKYAFNEVENFQLATGRSCSIYDFVKLAADLCENKSTSLIFGAVPYRKNEVMNIDIDLSRLDKLGWKAKYNLADGILTTIKDLMKHEN